MSLLDLHSSEDESKCDKSEKCGKKCKPVWPSQSPDLSNDGVQRCEFKIKPSNAKDFVKKWSNTTPGLSPQAQPSYSKDGILYIGTALNPAATPVQFNMYAINSKTGAIIWAVKLLDGSFSPFAPFAPSPANDIIFTTPVIHDKYVYVNTQSTVHKLDRFTGVEIWFKHIWLTDPSGATWQGEYLGNCCYADGKIIVPVANVLDESAALPFYFKGPIVALDANTGNYIWITLTNDLDPTQFVPGTGSYGMAAVDLKRRLIFLGTDNGAKQSATDTRMAGPLTDSLIALKLDTGILVWSYQFFAGDTFNSSFTLKPSIGIDLDVATHPTLFSVDGRDYVSTANKGGDYRIFLRDQKHPSNVQSVVWLHMEPGPGDSRGVFQGAMAVNDGVVYMASNSAVINSLRIDPLPNGISPTTGPTSSLINNFNEWASFRTRVWALDLRKLLKIGLTPNGAIPQKAIKWINEVRGHTFGEVTYANGVVFHANNFGEVRALDAKTGNELWSDVPLPFPSTVTINQVPATVPPTPTSIPVNMILPGHAQSSGITIANGKIFVSIYGGVPALFPFVVSPPNIDTNGGLFAYKIGKKKGIKFFNQWNLYQEQTDVTEKDKLKTVVIV